MNHIQSFNDFLAYIGLEDQAVLTHVVTDANPAFQYALNKLISLNNYQAVIANMLVPIRDSLVQPFQTPIDSLHPRFIELLMIKLIIENYLFSDAQFLRDDLYFTVRNVMFRLLPADMHYFPHEYVREDFRSRVTVIQSRPNTRGKTVLLAAVAADPQSRHL